ncbi:hypothetical protein BJ875DRAFT_440095 [Amylocarpus encephaloides]|uniref:Uncharacterized protein n=1 Tax=Amylocarpus encephaloides TaxID=45428 RepID=A0A9P7YLF1_9HELO|nr:hypothetical protein BJ875DRAFT_440095 [Amylocarpus encephaloides]
MAPKWPQVNNGLEHINEHATYLREAFNQLQAVDKGRQNQVPWNIVQPYVALTITLINNYIVIPKDSLGRTDSPQTCGYCAKLHETKNCKQKGVDGFTPRCTVCKGAHIAWSNACLARKKEMGRVEQAKQIRNIYWNVTPKDDNSKDNKERSRTRHTHNQRPNRTIRVEDSPILEPSLQPATVLAPPRAPERDVTRESQAPSEDIEMLTSVDQSAAEDWATPATQQDPTRQHSVISSQHIPTEQPLHHGQATGGISEGIATTMPADTESQPQILYPFDEIDGDFNIHDADAWLANLEMETARSPPTSLATDTRTAHGTVYKGCRCPSHQKIYSNWPAQDAELTITQCMKTCVYCGSDFNAAADLRKHLKRVKYARRNISICQGIYGKHLSDTPAWTPKESSTHRSDDATTRVYFYINKRIDLSTWTVSYITKDIITLEITNSTTTNKLSIFNVYNEVVTDTLSDVREAISKLDPHDELLVLGDFNLHHPL